MGSGIGDPFGPRCYKGESTSLFLHFVSNCFPLMLLDAH